MNSDHTSNNLLMRKLNFRLVRLTTLTLFCGWIAACVPPEQPDGVVYCSEGNPESFNPQTVTSGTTIDATSKQLYSRLVDYDADQGNIIPALASHWEISDDGLEYRFFLRPNVEFHQSSLFSPSRALNADDVVFSFDRILNPSNPYFAQSNTGYPFFQSIGFDKLVQSVTKENNNEVLFKLKHKDASFLSNLATDFAVILSAEYAEQMLNAGTPENLDMKAIGTGPFRLVDYVKNEYIRYRSHPYYWGKPPAIRNLVFDITPRSTVRLSKLFTGNCSVSGQPKATEFGFIEENPELVLQSKPGLNIAYWAFNTQKPPLDDMRVRRALALAVDKEKILRTVYQDTGIEAHGLLPPASWAYSRDHALDINYSPSEAKALLAEAGISNLSISIWATPVSRSYNPNTLKTAELIQADLANIGVKANIVSYDWSVFNQKLQGNNYDTVLIGWNADNSDPDNFFTPLLTCAASSSGNNHSHWCNPQFDSLLANARAETDRQTRKRNYQQAEAVIATELPLLALAHGNRTLILRNNIVSMNVPPFGGIAFDTVQTSKKDEN